MQGGKGESYCMPPTANWPKKNLAPIFRRSRIEESHTCSRLLRVNSVRFSSTVTRAPKNAI